MTAVERPGEQGPVLIPLATMLGRVTGPVVPWERDRHRQCGPDEMLLEPHSRGSRRLRAASRVSTGSSDLSVG